MHEIPQDLPTEKTALYQHLETTLRSLLEGETDLIANTANMAALYLSFASRLELGRLLFPQTNLPSPFGRGAGGEGCGR